MRTYPSLVAPPRLGNGYIANKHTKANALSHVCRPSCGSAIEVVESNGPLLGADQFYCMPKLSDWLVYDAVKDVLTLLGDAAMDSVLYVTRGEGKYLSIVTLYCDIRKEERGKAIPNLKNMRLCRAKR